MFWTFKLSLGVHILTYLDCFGYFFPILGDFSPNLLVTLLPSHWHLIEPDCLIWFSSGKLEEHRSLCKRWKKSLIAIIIISPTSLLSSAGTGDNWIRTLKIRISLLVHLIHLWSWQKKILVTTLSLSPPIFCHRHWRELDLNNQN